MSSFASEDRKDGSVPGIGLVLGAGGAVGHAFHAGVLAALEEETGWDPRVADVIVGTSAGSLVGALLRAGASAPDLAARATGGPISSAGRRLIARADAGRGNLPPIPSRRERGGFPSMSAPGALARAVRQPWSTRPAALAAALLPAGRVPTELVSAGLRPLFDAWPDAPLWINAVQLDTGRRVTFGRDTSVSPSVADAVAASCAIPAFFEPVVIDGTRYVDGGVHSPTNADLVAGLALDLVIVSSPMSIAGNGLRIAADQPARRIARFALGREVARVRRRGTPVLVFQPTAADVAVMGLNAMDDSRRAPVTRSSYESARRRIARGDAADRTAILRSSPSRTA
jgi:NTE family protein